MKAVKKDLFDINKVTVVGSPTITSDGVASGFSRGNYIRVPNIPSPTNSLNIEIGFVVPDTINVQHQILSGANSSNLATFFFDLNASNPQRYQLAFGTSDTADISGWLNLGDIDFGKYVKFKFTWDGSVYKFYKSVENSEYAQVGNSINSSTPINFSQFYVGVQSNTNTPYITGSIDLKEFKIYVDGELVYSPTRPTTFLERRKEGFDLSKFTVVGSPTITEDGVASGFRRLADGAIGFKIPSIAFSKSFTIKGYIPNIDITKSSTILNLSGDTSGTTKLYFETGYGTPFLKITIGGVNLETIGINTNSFYFKISFDGNNIYTLSYKTNKNDEWINKTATIQSLISASENIIIGYADYTNLNGSIDLSQFSITVDGKEVFTGAKEKFYAIVDF